MSKFVPLTCVEMSKEGGLYKYAIRVRETDIQVLVATELNTGIDPLPITVVWLPNGQRITVSETITEVERRCGEVNISKVPYD